MSKIEFIPPDKINLLGHFVHSLIERNIKTPKGEKVFRRMKGRILVVASGMEAMLHFQKDTLTISTEISEKPGARIAGSLETLLRTALGKGFVGPVLSGKLKIGGKFWRLLPLLKLFEAIEVQK